MSTITVDDLLAFCAIAQERGPWGVDEDGQIRNDRGECPICAAANVVLGEDRYETAAWSAVSSLLYGSDALMGETNARMVDCVTWSADVPSGAERAALMAALGMVGA